MKKRSSLTSKVCLAALASVLALNLPVMAQSTSLQDLQDLPSTKLPVVDTGKLDKNNWAYKTLENISKTHGLLVGKAKDKFDINKPLSRTEAAVILVSLVGKIDADNVQLTEAEKAQLDILKQEFNGELQQLTGRVANVETSVDSLKGSVSKLDAADANDIKTKFAKTFKIDGLLQADYTASPRSGPSTLPNVSNFTIPIVDLRLGGQMADHLKYYLQLVPSRIAATNSTGLIGDAFLSTDIVPHHTVYVGQSRVPTGFEATQANELVDTITKSQISRSGTGYGDQRAMGLKIAGDYKYLYYYAGLFDGSAQDANTLSTNNTDLGYAGWGAIRPFAGHEAKLGSLELGGGVDFGRTTTGITNNLVNYYGSWKYGKFAIKSEMAYKDGYSYKFGGYTLEAPEAAYHAKSHGFYVEPSYFLTKKLQVLAKFDQFNPDITAGNDRITEYTIGSNYYMANNNIKLQLNLVGVVNQAARNSDKIVVQTQYLF